MPPTIQPSTWHFNAQPLAGCKRRGTGGGRRSSPEVKESGPVSGSQPPPRPRSAAGTQSRGRSALRSRETSGHSKRVQSVRKWARKAVRCHLGPVRSRPGGVEGLRGDQLEAESPRSLLPLPQRPGLGPASAAPPFALHGARPSLFGAYCCASATCLSLFCFPSCSLPYSNARVAGLAAS